MAFHRIAFAEDVMSQDSSISPALLYDEMDFPPLQDGWQLLNEADADDDDHHHAFVHKVVPQEWDWQCITKEHRPALYAQVASRALDDDDINSSTTTFTLPVVAKPAARRRSSLLRKATDTWHPTFESQHDLGDELHGQYKSSHRRLRRSMKLSAKQRPRRQRYTTSVVFDHGHNVDEQGRKRRQRTTTKGSSSTSSSSNNKKIALEQGLDWVVSFP
ncbi:hypothetical protein O0I10_001267 [Lichtheimia ornata]|uniref:Uncharacterized protein n=1 Tax=Lichtheimia ornata TaxID=688661 RepID=A0AAD8DHT4_9FUNG|nr:uncharacterized protein O0I10_001267 [Lichtheimia ornata]KAJ8663090.1 hypothetical protein O0I10_001267 [Lichtheimia ornata]